MRRVIITGRNDRVPHHPFTTSGMMPVARAARDLPRFVGPDAHIVKRCVPGLLASHSPAADLPPDALPGAFLERAIDAATVIAGLIVFSATAYLLLVLA